MLRGHAQQGPQAGVDEARMLRHADAQHGDQHGADRSEAGEVGHHRRHEGGNGISGQQIVDHDRRAGARINHGKVDVGQQPGQDPGDEQQRDKQHGRVRNAVADAFYGAEKAAGLGCRTGDWFIHGIDPYAAG